MQVDAAKTWGERTPRGVSALLIQALKYRLIRGFLKKPVYRWLQRENDAFDIVFKGLKFRCHIADNGPERFLILQQSRRDWTSLTQWQQHLKAGDTFVDLGANAGLFSIYAAKLVGPSGRVIAIEPIPELVKRLRFNASANGFTNIHVVEAAVGASKGEAKLEIDLTSFARSSLNTGMSQQASSIRTPVLPLLDIVREKGLERIDGLKVDIEGLEDEALMPLFDAGERSLWPRVILIETLHRVKWRRDCISELLSKGYTVRWESNADKLLELN